MWCDFMPAIGGQLAVTADNYLDGDGSQWRLKIIFLTIGNYTARIHFKHAV